MRQHLIRFSSVFLILMMLMGFQLLTKAASVPQLTVNFTDYGTIAATGGTVTGKAQDDSGIRIIDVYVDNHYVESTRPDAQTGDFSFQLDTSGLSSGQHYLFASASANDGSSTYCDFFFNVASSVAVPAIQVSATDGAAISRTDDTFTGSAQCPGGIRQIDVYVDNRYAESVPADAQGNFTFAVDPSDLQPGGHSVFVTAIGNNGDNAWTTFTVNVPAATIQIAAGDSILTRTNQTFAGTAWNSSGIRQVDVYVDNQYAESVPVDAQGNFTFAVDPSGLQPGGHSVFVAAVGNNGDNAWTTFTVQMPAAAIQVAAGTGVATQSSNTFTGTAQNASGIRQVDVYIDNQYTESVAVDAQGNFSFPVAPAGFQPGGHSVFVAAVGNNGDNAWTAFTVQVPDPALGIDTADGSYVNNENKTITGWAVNPDGTRQVDVYVDNHFLTTVYTGTARSDASAIAASLPYGISDVKNSGYSFALNVDSISPGSHSVFITAIGNDGSSAYRNLTVNVAQPDMFVDTASYTYISDDDYQIKGWALDASGVSKVDVYIDNSYYGSYPVGGSRPDVNAARNTAGQYGVNAASNSGFTIPIGNSDLGLGSHYIFIEAIGNNGTSQYRDMFVYGPRVISQSFNITLSDLAADDGVSASDLDPANIESAGAAGQYEFMSLHYVGGVTADELNVMLNECGNLTGHGADFLAAAQKYDINPVYLVAHALHETGYGSTRVFSRLDSGIVFQNGCEYYIDASGNLQPVLNSSGNQVQGTPVADKPGYYTYTDSHNKPYQVQDGTYYNLWGIHAYDGFASWSGGIYAGSQGWSSVSAAIDGGAKYLHDHWITGQTYAQNTLYEMKWDPYGWANYGSAACYATDYDSITNNWAYLIADIIYQYRDYLSHSPIQFIIPQF